MPQIDKNKLIGGLTALYEVALRAPVPVINEANPALSHDNCTKVFDALKQFIEETMGGAENPVVPEIEPRQD